MRVLLVEDEVEIARPLGRALEAEGYDVRLAADGKTAMDLSSTWEPDVVLLDLQLPDVDGYEVARHIRTHSAVPIIMVTARGTERDKIVGLDIGADDYVVKPVSVPELVARIRAATRRASVPPRAEPVVTVGDLTVDIAAQRVTLGATSIELTAKEFELLRVLAVNAGRVVRRDELVHAVWGVSPSEGANTLDVHMSWLRKKIGDDASAPRYIETVRRVGFRMMTNT